MPGDENPWALRLRLHYPGDMLLGQPVARWLVPLALLASCGVLRHQRRQQDTTRYSFEDGVAALVDATQSWRTERECVSCHTNGWGLAAQPVIAPGSQEVAAGRDFAQGYLRKHLEEGAEPSGQFGSIEGVVSTAAFLAMSDARSGQAVHEVTRRGLDHAWSLLDESGTWEGWLQCNWPPFESDAEFGPTLVLVALGELRGIAELGAEDLDGARKLIEYLRHTPRLGLHAKAMRLWA